VRAGAGACDACEQERVRGAGGRGGRPGRLARAGQKRGADPLKEEKHFSNFIFNEFFKYQISNTSLSNKMDFSENDPKMKVT
jgi:hypothetical protein